MNFQEAVKSVFTKYATFKGRAMRSEYWWFALFSIIINFVLSAIHPTLSNIFAFAVFVPSLAVLVRRLHDVGKSGWYCLIMYIPLFIVVGIFIYIFSKVGITNMQTQDPEQLRRIFDDSAVKYLVIAGIIFFVTAIYTLVLLVTDSQPGDNEYGPNPKTEISQDDLDAIGNN